MPRFVGRNSVIASIYLQRWDGTVTSLINWMDRHTIYVNGMVNGLHLYLITQSVSHYKSAFPHSHTVTTLCSSGAVTITYTHIHTDGTASGAVRGSVSCLRQERQRDTLTLRGQGLNHQPFNHWRTTQPPEPQPPLHTHARTYAQQLNCNMWHASFFFLNQRIIIIALQLACLTHALFNVIWPIDQECIISTPFTSGLSPFQCVYGYHPPLLLLWTRKSELERLSTNWKVGSSNSGSILGTCSVFGQDTEP